MPQDTTSEQDPDDSDAEFVEIDPSARYGRVSFFFFLIFMKFIIFMRKIIGIFLFTIWVYFIGTVPNGVFFLGSIKRS